MGLISLAHGLREPYSAAGSGHECRGVGGLRPCADYLVDAKGLPFRDAYKITGTLVARCIEKGLTLETLPLSEYQEICPAFDEGVYDAISLDRCVNNRKVLGGPAPENVEAQAGRILSLLK